MTLLLITLNYVTVDCLQLNGAIMESVIYFYMISYSS